MKKALNVLLLLAFLMNCLTAAFAEPEQVSNNPMPEGLEELIEFDHGSEFVVDTYTKQFVEFWNTMPESFRKLLLTRKTTIRLGVSARARAELPKNGVYSSTIVKRVLGEYTPGNTIEAKFPIGEDPNVWEWNKITFEMIFYHELGHYMDDINHDGTFKYSASGAWGKVPRKQLDMIKDHDHQAWQNCVDDQEWFAEAFKIYMLDPEYLQENAPAAYKIVQKAIAEHMKKYNIK